MKTHLEFRSDRFPAYEGEEQQIQPRRVGKRLAEFLVDGLRRKGFTPNGLKLGLACWRVEIQNEEFPLWLACGCLDDDPDGFIVYIGPEDPYVRKLWPPWAKIDTRPRLETLQFAVDRILTEEEGIHDKHWHTYEEWMGVPYAGD